MVVMEAMLHGLPVLLGNFKTAPELLGTDPACGYVVPRHDPRAFAQAILIILVAAIAPAWAHTPVPGR